MTDITITSGVFYRDPHAAIEWLRRVLGFELLMLLETPDGAVAHAELGLGSARIMLGGEWGDVCRSPITTGGLNTQSLHVTVAEDVDGHFGRARAAGADVVAEPEDQFYGHRLYRCRDPEGHVWTVGQVVRQVSREEAERATGLKITGWTV
jgi:uncharacterized glyoxalase superfamily protein PhnB